MIEVVGIKFKKNGQMYYFSPNNLKLKKNTSVIVETERGLQFGIVDLENIMIESKKLKTSLCSVVRICTKKDLNTNQRIISDSKEALKKCRELVKKYKLNMIILDANYTFDKGQLLFTFLSENRIDFRQLAKDLASIYKTRIELRQLGVRDKAKNIGGYGSCGQPLCCSKFLTDFDSVSINMAKNQNIALNPNKINGICGRLLCCLKYEDQCYKECNKKLPKVGKTVETKFGEGKVISTEPLKLKYKVNIKEKGIIDVNLNEGN